MKFTVLKASADRIILWDRKTRDKWQRPTTYTIEGSDFSGFHSGDIVEILVRLVEPLVNLQQ